MLRRWGRREGCIGFWWEKLMDRHLSGDLGVDGRIILELTFRKWDVGVWTVLGWLRIETCVGHL
jgi:hypothetical protein